MPTSVLRQPGRLLERPVALRTGLATGVPFSKSALKHQRQPARRDSRLLPAILTATEDPPLYRSALGETVLTLRSPSAWRNPITLTAFPCDFPITTHHGTAAHIRNTNGSNYLRRCLSFTSAVPSIADSSKCKSGAVIYVTGRTSNN